MREEILQQNADPAKVLEEVARNHQEQFKSEDFINCEFCESLDDVPDPGDLDKTKKNVRIFDDLQLEKQNKCESY
jgi:hypothetical protein